MAAAGFEWDLKKDLSNQAKQHAFADPRRVIAGDMRHSTDSERRYYCLGEFGGGVLTVRFTYRGGVIRIFGAGYWTKGKRLYEQTNQVHRRTSRPAKDRR